MWAKINIINKNNIKSDFGFEFRNTNANKINLNFRKKKGEKDKSHIEIKKLRIKQIINFRVHLKEIK